MTDIDRESTVVRLFVTRWLERHGDQARSMELHFFENGVLSALADAIGDTPIDLAEPLPDESDSYGTVLILSARRLLTVRAADKVTFDVSYLGELPGGQYEEQLTVENEVIERTIRYTHPRLPAGQIEFSFQTGGRGKRFETLRTLLREWSTVRRP